MPSGAGIQPAPDGLAPVDARDDGLFTGQGLDGVHQLLPVLRGDVGGGLVKNDGRVFQHGRAVIFPAYREKIPLSSRTAEFCC